MKQQHDDNQSVIDKIYLYVQDPHEAKYQYLVKKSQRSDLKRLEDPESFIEYSNNIQDVYKNKEECNPGKKRKLFIIFNDMIADMISNNKLNEIVTQLFI